MASRIGRILVGLLFAAVVCFVAFWAAYVFAMLSFSLDRICIRWLHTVGLHPPADLLVEFLLFASLLISLAIWILPTLFVIGFAFDLRIRTRLHWGITICLLLMTAYVWWTGPSVSLVTPRICAAIAATVLACGIAFSFLHPPKPNLQRIAIIAAAGVLTVPFWIAFAFALPQPREARKLWSVLLQQDSSLSMNTGSSFGSRRQVVFAGNRILVSFEAGSAPYDGKQPMANYRLLSLDRNTARIMNSKEFLGKWANIPYLYATEDGHAVLSHGSLKLLNPDLMEAGPRFTADRGRISQISPDGATMAWETTPGTTLLDANTLIPLNQHLSESVPRSVSRRAVLTNNIFWYGAYPNDRAFVTLTDEKGQRLLFHGDCGGQADFLSDERVLLTGCGKVRILNLEGKILRETRIGTGSSTFAGVSQNGSRFAVAFSDGRGDPLLLLYEHFVIFDSETANPIAIVRMTDLPEYYSWSAFSPDGKYFVAGNPNNLSLYLLP